MRPSRTATSIVIMLAALACERAAPDDAGTVSSGAAGDTAVERVAPAAPAGGPATGQDSALEVTAAAGPVGRLTTLLDSAVVDLDGDGARDTLLLYAAVERDTRGRLMWDDGQRWLFLARVGAAEYPLFDAFVQLGRLGFHAIDRQDARPPLIVLREETGAGLRIWSFEWTAARRSFLRETVFEATGNVLHATPPPGGS